MDTPLAEAVDMEIGRRIRLLVRGGTSHLSFDEASLLHSQLTSALARACDPTPLPALWRRIAYPNFIRSQRPTQPPRHRPTIDDLLL